MLMWGMPFALLRVSCVALGAIAPPETTRLGWAKPCGPMRTCGFGFASTPAPTFSIGEDNCAIFVFTGEDVLEEATVGVYALAISRTLAACWTEELHAPSDPSAGDAQRLYRACRG